MPRYRYIGPCRCGFGPHAFYEDTETGKIVHAWEIIGEGAPVPPAWGGGGWGRGWGRGWGAIAWLGYLDEDKAKELAEAWKEAWSGVAEGEDVRKEIEELKKAIEELKRKLEEE